MEDYEPNLQSRGVTAFPWEAKKNLSSLFCSLAHAHSEACIVSFAIHTVGVTPCSDLILLHVQQVSLASLYSAKVPFSQPNRHFSF